MGVKSPNYFPHLSKSAGAAGGIDWIADQECELTLVVRFKQLLVHTLCKGVCRHKNRRQHKRSTAPQDHAPDPGQTQSAPGVGHLANVGCRQRRINQILFARFRLGLDQAH